MELRDIRTYRSYDPRNLVTKHRRHRDTRSSKQQIGVAQARRLHIDENFASYRRRAIPNVLEIESRLSTLTTSAFIWPSLHSGECFWPFRYFMLRAVAPGAREKRNRCTRWTAIAPSPTADATRLTLPARVSPTANIPGTLVSSRSGERLKGHRQLGASGKVRAGNDETLFVEYK